MNGAPGTVDNGDAPAFIGPIEEFREGRLAEAPGYDAGRYFASLERYLLGDADHTGLIKTRGLHLSHGRI